MVKRIGNLKSIIGSIKRNNKIVIVGLGNNGKDVCNYFISQNISVKCFIDEDQEKVHTEYMGVPVLMPQEYNVENNDIFVICIQKFIEYTDEQILQKSVIKNLNASDDKILLLDRMILNRELLLKYFKEENVNLKSEILEFKGLKLPNYFKMNENVIKSFLVESGDLILPTYFNDWSNSVEGPYDNDKLACIRGGGGYVIDCGANIGIFSAIAASKGCNVYALEPIPETRKILEKVVEIYPNVIICDYAVSDFDGEIYITNTDDLESNKITNSTDNSAIKVKCCTIDNFVKENNIKKVDFIKADIEGAERNMLIGARQTLQKHQPNISICTYHLDDDPEVLENIIISTNSNYVVQQRSKKLFASIIKNKT